MLLFRVAEIARFQESRVLAAASAPVVTASPYVRHSA